MMDPTTKSGIGLNADERWGVLIRVHIAGNVDGVFGLPSELKTEAEINTWLLQLGLRMADPKTKEQEFTPQELSFVKAIFDTASMMINDGVEWKPLRVFNPKELVGIIAGIKRLQQ